MNTALFDYSSISVALLARPYLIITIIATFQHEKVPHPGLLSLINTVISFYDVTSTLHNVMKFYHKTSTIRNVMSFYHVTSTLSTLCNTIPFYDATSAIYDIMSLYDVTPTIPDVIFSALRDVI